jgi:hypothetical protein
MADRVDLHPYSESSFGFLRFTPPLRGQFFPVTAHGKAANSAYYRSIPANTG